MNENILKFPSRKCTKEKPPPPVYDDGWLPKELNARIHQIRKMVDQAPKMSPEDSSQVARNLDKILKREKAKVSLGALCGDVGLGDGRDPKALYHYRNTADSEDCNRRLVKNAKKYIRIVEALASLLNQDEKPLLKELFWKSSYDDERMREEGTEPDIVFDLLDLIDGMTHWICQTLPIEEAFKLAEENNVDYDRLRAEGRRAYVGVDWLITDFGFPRVPIFEIDERYENKHHLVQASDGRELNLRTVRATSLGIGPDKTGRPIPAFFSGEYCFVESTGRRYPIQDVVPEREAIEISIVTEDGPEKLNVTSPELPDLWDEWVGGSLDDFHIDEYHERVMNYLDGNFSELSNARGLADWGDMEFQAAGVNVNELKKIVADCQFVDIWGESLSDISPMTITYGSGKLPKLRNIIVGGRLPHNPRRDLEWIDEYVRKRNLLPPGGWPRGHPPKSDDFTVPELLWVEAKKYTQEVIGAVKLRGAIEKHEQDLLLSHFRSTPKKP